MIRFGEGEAKRTLHLHVKIGRKSTAPVRTVHSDNEIPAARDLSTAGVER